MDLRAEEATYKAVVIIAHELRKIDQKEIFLATGQPPENIVLASYDQSNICKVVRTRNTERPIAVFGIANPQVQPINYKIGVPWMVATDKLREYGKSFMQAALHWVRYLQGDYDLMVNYCLPENTTSILWLRKMGFEFDETLSPFGYFEHDFIKFWRYKDV